MAKQATLHEGSPAVVVKIFPAFGLGGTVNVEAIGVAYGQVIICIYQAGEDGLIMPMIDEAGVFPSSPLPMGSSLVCHKARVSHGVGPLLKEVATLVPVIRTVLDEAIAAGGSSLRDYRQANGALGYFQHGFQAYDRAGQPCLRPGCGGEIVRVVQAGRSSFFCPSCQVGPELG